jgi:hypothetical protein
VRHFLRFLLTKGSTRKSPKPYHRTPCLEGLEERTLLSVTMPPPGTTGPVVMTGSNLPDNFVIRESASLVPGPGGTPATMLNLSDNGGKTWHTIALSDVTSIAVHGMGGQDKLVINNNAGLIGNANGLPISFDGTGNHNTLVIRGGPSLALGAPQPLTSPYTETYTLSKPGVLTIATTSGTANGTMSQTITFRSAAKVVDMLPAASCTVNVHGSVSDSVTIVNASVFDGVATDRINSAIGGGPGMGMPSFLLVPVVFANKTNVQINTLDKNDTFVLNVSLSANQLKSLTLVGGPGQNNTAFVRQMPPHVQVHFVHIQHIVREDLFFRVPSAPTPTGIPL